MRALAEEQERGEKVVKTDSSKFQREMDDEFDKLDQWLLENTEDISHPDHLFPTPEATRLNTTATTINFEN